MKKTILSVCTMLSALDWSSWPRAADEHKHRTSRKPWRCWCPPRASDVDGTILLKQEKGYVQVTGEVRA